MNKLLEAVKKMHEYYGISYNQVDFNQEEKEFRISGMREEINEYIESNEPVNELDALVDLIIFALGTIERQGFGSVFDEAFRRVMASNMIKELGPLGKRNSFELNLRKPPNWEAPDLSDLVFNIKKIDNTMRERLKTHGSFEANAKITQGFERVLKESPNYDKLSDVHKEAFHLILHKISRSVCGDSMCVDHIHDIVGYAKLLESFILNNKDKGC